MEIERQHERYSQQSVWTSSSRQYLINKLSSKRPLRVLDVGYGTGAVNNPWPQKSCVHGIDINLEALRFAKDNSTSPAFLAAGDAYKLPYADHSFDLVTCHFLLLWLSEPEQAIDEMIRVCKSGGTILFFSEPDYGARIDYPESLEAVGVAQFESLRKQGADPLIGRKIAGYAAGAGLQDLEIGIIGYQTGLGQDDAFWRNEWDTIRFDLEGLLPKKKIDLLEDIDQAARQKGSRILFVPTFYLFAVAP